MNHQCQPNEASCLLTSVAMLWGVRVEYLMSLLKHDGTEIIFPDLTVPRCYRGFNMDEIMYLAWLREHVIYVFNREVIVGHDEVCTRTLIGPMLWKTLIENNDCVILNDSHAFAWDYKKKILHDPSRRKEQIVESIKTEEYNLVIL